MEGMEDRIGVAPLRCRKRKTLNYLGGGNHPSSEGIVETALA